MEWVRQVVVVAFLVDTQWEMHIIVIVLEIYAGVAEACLAKDLQVEPKIATVLEQLTHIVVAFLAITVQELQYTVILLVVHSFMEAVLTYQGDLMIMALVVGGIVQVQTTT